MATNNSLDNNKIKLICLPFSGGSGFAFQPLASFFPSSWEVITLTYPGRGQRIAEPLVYTMADLLEDSWQQIKGQLRQPYVLFGHSLGSTLAYLLAHKIKENQALEPLSLILSGTDGPSVPSETPYRYLYSKADFKAKLDSYGGISQEILNDSDAFDFFEPIIRADFQVVETWQYQIKPKLNIPAMVITGTEEDMTLEEIRLWQKEFELPVHFARIKGNHFFLFKRPQVFVNLIQQRLKQILSKQPLTISNG